MNGGQCGAVLDSPGSTTTEGIVPSTNLRGPRAEWREEARILTCVNVWAIRAPLPLPEGGQDLRQAELGQAASAIVGALEGADTLAVAHGVIAKPGKIDILEQASAATVLQDNGGARAVARECNASEQQRHCHFNSQS